MVNITKGPDYPYLGWELIVHDTTLRFDVVPMGHRGVQIFIFVISWLGPVLTSLLAVWCYVRFFYKIKINRVGINYKIHGIWAKIPWKQRSKDTDSESSLTSVGLQSRNMSMDVLGVETGVAKRRCVLISTIEYDISDWNIKIKIGGLGVMVSKALSQKLLTLANMNRPN